MSGSDRDLIDDLEAEASAAEWCHDTFGLPKAGHSRQGVGDDNELERPVDGFAVELADVHSDFDRNR